MAEASQSVPNIWQQAIDACYGKNAKLDESCSYFSRATFAHYNPNAKYEKRKNDWLCCSINFSATGKFNWYSDFSLTDDLNSLNLKELILYRRLLQNNKAHCEKICINPQAKDDFFLIVTNGCVKSNGSRVLTLKEKVSIKLEIVKQSNDGSSETVVANYKPFVKKKGEYSNEFDVQLLYLLFSLEAHWRSMMNNIRMCLDVKIAMIDSMITREMKTPAGVACWWVMMQPNFDVSKLEGEQLQEALNLLSDANSILNGPQIINSANLCGKRFQDVQKAMDKTWHAQQLSVPLKRTHSEEVLDNEPKAKKPNSDHQVDSSIPAIETEEIQNSLLA